MFSSRKDAPFLLLFTAFLIAGLGAAFTYMTLAPQIGFDDANITQTYARHLAQGHGYVYNIGGERVEGSTSLLWTLINTVAFYFLDAPEFALAILCLILTAGTIFISLLITRKLTGPDYNILIYSTGGVFLIFPGFFGWMVWSLMDTTLWIFMITLLFYILLELEQPELRAERRKTLLIGLGFIAALLPITRPEGIALTLGLAVLLGLQALVQRKRATALPAVILAGVSLAMLLAVSMWRLNYFGHFFPNTFYAKTSSDIVAQSIQGAHYILSYLDVSHNTLLIVLLGMAGSLTLLRGRPDQKAFLLISGYLFCGGAVVYMVLGGDHFGSHRFFLFIIPIGIPIIISALTMIKRQRHRRTSKMEVLPVLSLVFPFLLIGAVSGKSFLNEQGHIAHEFRIAEKGREWGEILNALPGTPVVGIVAAGGFRMGYDGEVQDLLGLNWVLMAHAAPDARVSVVPNHGGFNQDIFWSTPSDIFIPYEEACPAQWQPVGPFYNEVTDFVSDGPRFQAAYDLGCYEGLIFHVSKDYLSRITAAGDPVPFQVIRHQK